MILPIVTNPNPVLRQQARVIEPSEIPSLLPFIQDMFDTLGANRGVGLAAPQVGQSISMFVVRVDGRDMVFINPVVISASDDTDEQDEGCLSLPGLVLRIKRSKTIKVMFRDAAGNQQIIDLGEGWSRIFLHEFDHLHGIMIDDRVSKLRLDLAQRKMAKKHRKQGVRA